MNGEVLLSGALVSENGALIGARVIQIVAIPVAQIGALKG